MAGRFIIQPSKEPGFWVVTDTEHKIVIRFQEHHFNETQKITLLDGAKFAKTEDTIRVATYLREAADWLRDEHYDKAMPPIDKEH